MDYSVDLLTLPHARRPLRYNDLENFDRVRVLNIAHDVVFDDDCGGHFACMKSLEYFRVAPSCSIFYEKNGVLYSKGEFYKDFFRDINNDDEILIAVPPAYRGDSFVVPEGVTAIYNGAFCGTSFKSITFPESLKVVGFHAIDDVSGLECLYIPNKDLRIYDQMIYNKPIEIKSNNAGELDEKVYRYWAWWLNPCDKFIETEDTAPEKGWLTFRYIYPRKYVYPSQEIKELVESVFTKASLLETLETLKEKYPVYAEFMNAMLWLQTDVTSLHCNSTEEARRIIRLLWGSEEEAKDWVINGISLEGIEFRDPLMDMEEFIDMDEYIETSFWSEDIDSGPVFESWSEYKKHLFATAHLVTSAPMLFLDYLGNAYLRDEVIIPKAVSSLAKLASEGDDFAAMNLLKLYNDDVSRDFYPDKYTEMALAKRDIIALYEKCEDYIHILDSKNFEINTAQLKHVESLVEACLREDNYVETTDEWSLEKIRKRVKKCEQWVKLHFVIKEAIPQQVAPKETKKPKKSTTSTKNASSTSESFTRKNKRISTDDDSQQLNLFGNLE